MGFRRNRMSIYKSTEGKNKINAGTKLVQEIPLSDLYDFKGHLFKMLVDEKMQETWL